MRPYAVMAVLCSFASPAGADFEIGHSAVEVSVDYEWRPIRFATELDPVTATGIHVTDRNGLFGRFVARMLYTPGVERDDPYETIETGRTQRYLGSGVVAETVHYKTQLRKGYETEEEREQRHREKLAHRRKVLSFNDYNTELRVWVPRDGQSVAKGAAFGMTTAVASNKSFSIEMGLRWQYLRVDNGCGDAMAPTRCTSKFFGVPLTVVISLGRLGRAEAGVGWNWRRSTLVDNVANLYPLHAGITIDVIDRVFIHGRVLSSIEDHKNVGFALAVGGRL